MKRWKTLTLLVGTVLFLLALGIVMLASASSVRGDTFYYDAQFFLIRQLRWLGVALVAGITVAWLDYRKLQPFVWVIGAVALIMLIMVLIPGIGAYIGGSRRWFRFGSLSFQPTELAKVAMVIVLAHWLAFNRPRVAEFGVGVVAPIIPLGVAGLLVLLEPDLGTAVLMVVVGLLMLFLGGARPLYLFGLMAIGAVLLTLFVWTFWDNPKVRHRVDRVRVFVDPDRNPAMSYQSKQSQESFTMGGVTGRGLGKSLQKHFYLPESHTDFILPIIGEELGIAASVGVVVLFGALFLAGITISIHAPDAFGRFLGLGLTLLIATQTLINVGVVTGCLPTKGLPLPFISYGGSSLVMSLVSVGLLVSIARRSPMSKIPDKPELVILDRFHEF